MLSQFEAWCINLSQTLLPLVSGSPGLAMAHSSHLSSCPQPDSTRPHSPFSRPAGTNLAQTSQPCLFRAYVRRSPWNIQVGSRKICFKASGNLARARQRRGKRACGWVLCRVGTCMLARVVWHGMTYACAATQVEERGHTHIDGAEWEHAQNSVWDKAPEGNNDANVKRWKLLADGGMASC